MSVSLPQINKKRLLGHSHSEDLVRSKVHDTDSVGPRRETSVQGLVGSGGFREELAPDLSKINTS